MNPRPQVIRILLLAAEPSDMARMRLDQEFREIGKSLQRAKYRDRFEVDQLLAARPADLQQGILDVRPQIVHFCGHGLGSRGLAFEEEQGNARLIPTDDLADLLRLSAPELRCVVLNACYSDEQAQVTHQHIDYVIGMQQEISDAAAISFSRGFYDALFANEPVERAFDYGKNAIRLEGPRNAIFSPSERHLLLGNASAGVAILEHLKPVILRREGAEPFPLIPGQASITRSEIEARFETASQVLIRWETTLDGGKWLDRPELQQLEEWLGNEKATTLVLLGEPGSGKSALLAKLGQWARERGTPVLAIKADAIAPSVNSVAELTADLKLPLDVLECIRRVAATKEVVVLIDQLDALASLVDLRSERLNVLLDLVREVCQDKNVKVICSCRQFEFKHDVRLSSIQAESVTLNLPAWEQVSKLLKERGIEGDSWPGAFRELLRTPQHLKLFLERLNDTSEYRVFNGYQQMLDDLWERRVANPDGLPGRAELLMEMAEQMASSESLWLPLARYEERNLTVRDLEAKGILVRNEGGLGIGFRHQTLFEHTRARAFARGHGSIAAYTLGRQDSLFIRPTLWNILRYLREAAPEAYHDEMGRLWEGARRRHIRFLLVDFLGQVQNPTEREKILMLEALAKPDCRPRALAACRGSAAWFGVLAPSLLPAVMQTRPEDAWPAVPILADALRFTRSESLELIRRHWMPEPGKDLLTWRVLEQLTEWDEGALDLACIIARRGDVSPFSVMSLAMVISAHEPLLAPRVVAASLGRSLRLLEEAPNPLPPTRETGESDQNFHVQEMLYRPKEKFERLLKSHQGWHELPALAEAAPNAFIDQLWPWLVRILAHLESDRNMGTVFKENWSLAKGLDPEDVTHREHPLTASFDLAVRAFAEQSPDEFLTFLAREGGHDSQLVQRLLCRGLGAIAAGHPGAGLDFLKGDPRRFRLGSFNNMYADTTALITAIVPHLTVGQKAELEEGIFSCRRFDEHVASEEPELRFEASKRNREHRLRLLRAFPEGTLTPRAQSIVEAETLALPHFRDPEVRFTSGRIGSPMSAEQMTKAKDVHIANLFEELVDETHDNHPTAHFRAGSAQASHEFGRFARENPKRAVSIIREFEPGRQERPAATALVEIAKTDFPDQDLFDLITDLDRQGFNSEEYRTCAAIALRERLRVGTGLPDQICDLLEKWRTSPWTLRDEVQRVKQGDETRDENPSSILWEHGGIVAVSQGSYNVLHALTYAYLLRRPPLTDRWLAMLRDHLQRPERSAVWCFLASDLRNLKLCDRAAASLFLQDLFARFPDVRDNAFGAQLIIDLWTILPDKVVDSFVAAIRDSSWPDGPQLYGELLALRAMVFPDNRAVKRDLHRWFRPRIVRREKADFVRLGMAYTAIQFWNQPGKRGIANDLLMRLIPFAVQTSNQWTRIFHALLGYAKRLHPPACSWAWTRSLFPQRSASRGKAKPEHLANAIMSIFLVCNDFPADEYTRAFLEQVLSYSEILRSTEDNFLVEHLEDLLPGEPELVFRLSEELIRHKGPELRSIQFSFAMSAAHLTNIALTLQRCGGEYRSKGLELFEQLLALGVPDTQSTLNEARSEADRHSAIDPSQATTQR